jgi:hypothetical protein
MSKACLFTGFNQILLAAIEANNRLSPFGLETPLRTVKIHMNPVVRMLRREILK